MSTTGTYDGPVRVGAIRPSQAVHSYGVGSLVDLPNLSVMISGLDRWDTTQQEVITEERLLGAVRARLGDQVERLHTLPVATHTTDNPHDEWARIGLPVTVFPRWLRCTRCNHLFHISTGALQLESNMYRPERNRYVHPNCTGRKPPPAVPARFVAGCANGHLDDFPWIYFVHREKGLCANPVLKVYDVGPASRATNLRAVCETCDASTSLAAAFGNPAKDNLPQCRGRHPHIGQASEPCTEQLRTLVLGASNLWFSAKLAALSLPVGGGSLAQLVHDHWGELSKMPTKDVLIYALSTNPPLQTAFSGHDVDEIWAAMEAHGGGSLPPQVDVLGPEWDALTTGSQGLHSPHFEAEPIPAPETLHPHLAQVSLAHRLRVVTALCGFTRINASEPGEDNQPPVRLVGDGSPTWVPVVENRGEGIFLQLPEPMVQQWEAGAYDNPMFEELRAAHRDWRESHGLDPHEGWPGERYVLLHSLSHALINELAIECGYSAASICERIYSRRPAIGPTPMAGILLYTSAPDAEGTLGGLVNLGRPGDLEPLLRRARERMSLCSSDPLCSDHVPAANVGALHGAACHACLLVPETSCERANRYLDRSTLVDTFRHTGLAYFPS